MCGCVKTIYYSVSFSEFLLEADLNIFQRESKVFIYSLEFVT